MPKLSLRYLPVICGCTLLLTACEQGKQMAQQAASAAAATVDQSWQQKAGQVADQLKSTLAPVGVDASQVVAKAKDTVSQHVKQALSPQADWQALDGLIGLTVAKAGLLAPASLIMPDLKRLLGADLPVLLDAMAVSQPLKKDQVLYAIGSGVGHERSWLLIDTQQRKLEVGLVRQGKVKVYRSAGEPLFQPTAVKQIAAE